MTSPDQLLDELLRKPVGKAMPAAKDPAHLTRQVEVVGDLAEVVVKGAAGEVNEDAAREYIVSHGLDPDGWIATGFRSSEWTMANGETGVSTRFTFARAGSPLTERPPIDELVSAIEHHEPVIERPAGEHGFLVLLGDMQFGKIDGDGAAGTLRRTVECINRAADALAAYSMRFDIGHVHIGFLGDHVEGFQSQGGANVWRTQLTLSEQIRLTRRVMLHAMTTFAPLARRITMAAVPGNHGETTRFAGKGVTRHDDSHDTESLVAVHDAAQLNGEAFGHVEFLVPDTDEMTVVVEVAGTVVAHAHGHQWRAGKHWEWWRGQAFAQQNAMRRADLLVAGHLHHQHIENDGERLFIQVPSMESESTWWRHRTGTGGAPGLIVAVTRDGLTDALEVVR